MTPPASLALNLSSSLNLKIIRRLLGEPIFDSESLPVALAVHLVVTARSQTHGASARLSLLASEAAMKPPAATGTGTCTALNLSLHLLHWQSH